MNQKEKNKIRGNDHILIRIIWTVFTVFVIGILMFVAKSTTKQKNQIQSAVKNVAQTKPELSYSKLLNQIEEFRINNSKKYHKSNDIAVKGMIIESCRDSLFQFLVDDIFPAWYGTGWHFNGISPTPKPNIFPYIENAKVDTNRIACGYFVTRILQKINFKINPYKIAQMYSVQIVRYFSDSTNIFYSNRESVSKLKDKISKHGRGIFLVGLDCHVGFIVYDGNSSFKFVHSSYYDPPLCVISEDIDTYNPLKHSKGRVIGKLFSDDMIRKWLVGEKF
jgi:hypothetical protein